MSSTYAPQVDMDSFGLEYEAEENLTMTDIGMKKDVKMKKLGSTEVGVVKTKYLWHSFDYHNFIRFYYLGKKIWAEQKRLNLRNLNSIPNPTKNQDSPPRTFSKSKISSTCSTKNIAAPSIPKVPPHPPRPQILPLRSRKPGQGRVRLPAGGRPVRGRTGQHLLRRVHPPPDSQIALKRRPWKHRPHILPLRHHKIRLHLNIRPEKNFPWNGSGLLRLGSPGHDKKRR